ncbi:hypothetical protein DHD08_19290 [Arenibacter sp. H213]|nr:hypothetical protein [Arenibacter sp. H213]
MGAIAQTMTVPKGSIIVDLGIVPQTVNNGLKPYGLVYELINIRKVPVIWSINLTKSKDGTDFTVDGRNFSGGPFIISKLFLADPNVQATITTWQAKGVITYTTLTDVEVPLYRELNIWPQWVLDTKNGKIAQNYLDLADIPSSAYTTALPSGLDACDDLFILPHADPNWGDHGYLYDWNKSFADGGSEGWIWSGCHAVSVLESLVDPLDSSRRMNFLSNDPLPHPDPAHSDLDGYGLIDFGDHDDGSPPYNYSNPTDSYMQFMGVLDGATNNGSEQIYLPYPTGSWRASTIVSVWDPSHTDISNGNSPGMAAKIAYGHAFGDADRGKVMYEGGHDLAKGSTQEQVAAIRAFLNFSFDAPAKKAPQLTNTLIVPEIVEGGDAINFDVDASSTSGNSYTFTWTSTCSNGTFSGTTNSSNNTKTSFTTSPATIHEECIITLTVTDLCGRQSFKSYGIKIIPPPAPPVANDDNYVTYNSNSITIDVLNNDTDVNLNINFSTFSPTSSLNVLGGEFYNNGNGSVSFVPNSTFTGSATLTYQICDDTPAIDGGPMCDTATIHVEIYDSGCASNEYVSGTTSYGQSISNEKDWKDSKNAEGAPDDKFSRAEKDNAYVVIDLGGNVLVGTTIKFRVYSNDDTPTSGTLDANAASTGFPKNPMNVNTSAKKPAVDIISYTVTEMGTRFLRVQGQKNFGLESVTYEKETCIPYPIINAIDDDFSTNVINANLGGTAGDVTANDLIDGAPFNDPEVSISVIDNDGLTGLTIDANGNLMVPFGFNAGTYNIVYKICETPRLNNCDSALVIVTLDRDSDNDGIFDEDDLDDDNDGIPDVMECVITDSGHDGSYPSSSFSYNITSADPSNVTENHVLNSITLNGDTFSDFIVPDSYVPNFSNVNNTKRVYLIDHYTDSNDFNTDPNFMTNILPAFQSRDLNYYHTLNLKNFTNDNFTLTYNNPITTTGEVFLALTERNGNNPYFVEALDAGNNVLGSITVNVTDYVDTGHQLHPSATGTAYLALFPIDDIAPLGSKIRALRISFPGATSDGPDGKVFFFGNFSAANCDSDGDGIPDVLDLDSDNDGIYDAVEAGHNQPHTNGKVNGPYGPNGLANVVETSPDSGVINYSLIDTDSDATPDYLDEDSDGDNCNDANEAYHDPNTDADNNGMYGSGLPSVYPDGTVMGAMYQIPEDADANGIYDFMEFGVTPTITTQPTDFNICPGCIGTIFVEASPSVTYQWQILLGTEWTNITDYGVHNGVATDKLTITNPTPSDSNNSYRVVVSNFVNVCGVATSDSATLTIKVKTVITNRRITYRVKKN